jgi:hypothetical protein
MNSELHPCPLAEPIACGDSLAGGRDIVLLNDDALLQTSGGFTLLQKAAAEDPEYGLIAAACNNVGNENQFPKGIGLREDPRMVCFVAVLIPRRTIDLVGLLDEASSWSLRSTKGTRARERFSGISGRGSKL